MRDQIEEAAAVFQAEAVRAVRTWIAAHAPTASVASAAELQDTLDDLLGSATRRGFRLGMAVHAPSVPAERGGSIIDAADLIAAAEPNERLRAARIRAGFRSGAAAVRAHGFEPQTYKSHEAGTRGIRHEVASQYGAAFNVPPEWILFGANPPIWYVTRNISDRADAVVPPPSNLHT